jgi:hypothetical protein
LSGIRIYLQRFGLSSSYVGGLSQGLDRSVGGGETISLHHPGRQKISESFGCDHGIEAQSILLGAAEQGFGGCILGSIRRASLRKALRVESHYEILPVIALGKPKELVEVDRLGPSVISNIGAMMRTRIMFPSALWMKSLSIRQVLCNRPFSIQIKGAGAPSLSVKP